MRDNVGSALVETNILVCAAYQDSLHHGASRALIERAQRGELQLCLAPQVLMEFYVGMTSPRRISQLRTPQEAVGAMNAEVESPGFLLFPVPADLIAQGIGLIQRSPVAGAAVYARQLAATMLGHGVRRIYTSNTWDFQQIPEIEALTP